MVTIKTIDAAWAEYVRALKRLHAATPGTATYRKAEQAEADAWKKLEAIRPT